ncbi:hypothetical protein N7G274_007203 [Stereocaulon virgatum]|uniref:Uncharacterized protein n=1 Tax=Stereocaulon virgatum TaxID=373712 RepID=A0ABR4A4E5_9LECA
MATDNVFAELQQLVVAMLAAHSLQQREPSVVDPFLDMYLDGYGPDMKTLDAIKDPFNALQDLYETYMAIETFTPLFAKSRIQNMYLPTKGSQPWGLRYTDAIWEPDLHHLVLISRRWHDDLPEDGTWPSELPLSDDESYRIKRALWRFQLYSVLFHLPGFNDTCNIAMNIASAQTQPLLIDQQCRYLGKFNAWEVEELATVYDYLLTYLEACYDGPVTTKDIDRVTSQAEDPLTDGQSTTRNENLTTTTDSPSLETPGVDQDAAIQAEVEHFRRRIRYQLSRGLPFLYKFKLKLENVGPNDYVDGFDLENHTLDVGLGEALWHPNMACKNHGSRYLPGIGPQWDPAIGSFGKAGHPLRVWPDNPYAHIPTAGWKICIALRSWKATLVEVYASEELQAMRAVGGIFFDGVDELEDYTSLESREEDEEELLWDWDE